MAREGRGRSRYEQVGALETIAIRLGIWTGPTDVEVPPFPWARVLIGAAVVVLVCAITIPLLLDEKDRNERKERKSAAAEHRRTVARITEEQAPQRAQLVPPLPAGADDAARLRSRDRLIRALEAAITEDAQARYSRRALPSPVERTECRPFVRPKRANPPHPPLSARSGRYECFAVSSELPATPSNEAGVGGFPFWARVDFVRGRAVWCKVRPRPAEGAVGGSVEVPLPRVCELRKG